jgi:EpsD family peptidyl-prolyl cis-trans isomerase
MMNHLPSRFALSILAATLALGLTACGNKSDKKVATQVAAQVDAEEISVHQINQALSRTKTANVTPEAVKAMSRDVLEKLIDQQLAVNQAKETKLDRTPEVISQLEAARLDILARAYVQKIAGALTKPTPEEVKKYYAEHPQLFAERRVYNIQEIVVPAAAGVAKDLQGFATSGQPIEAAAAWLTSKDIKFGGGAATRAAEQIPLDLLSKIHTLKDGQSLMIQSPQNVTLLRLASSKQAPVAEAAALPSIEQFLTNQRASEAVTANIKLLRSKAKIAYQGEFTKEAGATPEPVAPAPVAAASAEAKAQVNLEKGVAGLK